MIKFLKTFCAVFAISITLSACSANGGSAKNLTTTTPNTTEIETNTTTPTVTELGNDFADYTRDKVVWGPGNIVDHQRPTDPVSLQETFGNIGAKFILEDKKTMCLTFDEGYENGYTPAILDTLKEKNVKAIFFVTYDFAKDNPKLIQRMIDEGHIVGNHTYRHYTMDEVDLSVAEEEITYLHNYIRKNFNYEMTLFRFPKGEFSQQTLFLAKSLSYTSVFWSFAYEDWNTESQIADETALKTLTDSTHNGAIYLLHAVSSTNANILGDFIDSAEKEGYKFTINI